MKRAERRVGGGKGVQFSACPPCALPLLLSTPPSCPCLMESSVGAHTERLLMIPLPHGLRTRTINQMREQLLWA